jgi:hypothetical protein
MPNYEIGYKNLTASLLATVAAATITELYSDLLPTGTEAHKTAFLDI